MKTTMTWMRGGVALAALLTGLAAAQAGSLKIESWRNDDADIWNSKIIPAFNKHYPDIKVEFAPLAPTEYNAALNARLDGGAAGDLITCRPFDRSLELYHKQQLDGLNDLKGMDEFLRRRQGRLDDRRRQDDLLRADGLRHPRLHLQQGRLQEGRRRAEPKTMAEFHDMLDKLKKDGTYTPIEMGTADQWEAATMGFQNIGPDYWKGETGRLALIAGKDKFTDPQYVAVWKELACWAPYMGNGFQAQKYPDSQNLFSLGKARDLSRRLMGHLHLPRRRRKFAMGAFPPPLPAGDKECYISDHTDIAHGPQLGLQEQGRRQEVSRMAGDAGIRDALRQRAARLLPAAEGRRSKSSDDLAATMVGWRKDCKSTIRNSYQILSRGTPNLENELWNVSAQVINGAMTP